MPITKTKAFRIGILFMVISGIVRLNKLLTIFFFKFLLSFIFVKWSYVYDQIYDKVDWNFLIDRMGSERKIVRILYVYG